MKRQWKTKASQRDCSGNMEGLRSTIENLISQTINNIQITCRLSTFLPRYKKENGCKGLASVAQSLSLVFLSFIIWFIRSDWQREHCWLPASESLNLIPEGPKYLYHTGRIKVNWSYIKMRLFRSNAWGRSWFIIRVDVKWNLAASVREMDASS